MLAEYKAAIAAEMPGVLASSVRFVILVDDLDRCLPDTTIRVLESIKNHLTVPDAVFVLALNARVVYQGIRQKYNNVEVNGREYLEKILNNTFYVPEPDERLLVTFGEASFNVSDFERETGMRIVESYSQMARMRELFRFSYYPDRRKPDLSPDRAGGAQHHAVAAIDLMPLSELSAESRPCARVLAFRKR